MKKIIIFGAGYTGLKLAAAMQQKGWEVAATTRRGTPQMGGVKTYGFSHDNPIEDDRVFDGVTHVLSTIPVVDGQDPVLQAHRKQLQELKPWAGYVSATSVYSEASGGWVNEDSPTMPLSKRGQWRRDAEIAWQESLGAEVFRAAGIYGAERSPFKKLLEKTARIINKPGHQFNRIHVDDIVQIIAAAMDRPRDQRILNLADGNPCEAGDVIRYAAALLGVESPNPIDFEKAELSPMARSFYATSRKVDSRRVAGELNLKWLYPDYQSGLRACLEEEKRTGYINV